MLWASYVPSIYALYPGGSNKFNILSEKINADIVMVLVAKSENCITFQWVNFLLMVFNKLSGLIVPEKVVVFWRIFERSHQKTCVKIPSGYLKFLGEIKFVKEKNVMYIIPITHVERTVLIKHLDIISKTLDIFAPKHDLLFFRKIRIQDAMKYQC